MAKGAAEAAAEGGGSTPPVGAGAAAAPAAALAPAHTCGARGTRRACQLSTALCASAGRLERQHSAALLTWEYTSATFAVAHMAVRLAHWAGGAGTAQVSMSV